jgi:hypothetical protein
VAEKDQTRDQADAEAVRSERDALREHYAHVQEELQRTPGFGENTRVAVGNAAPVEDTMTAAEALAQYSSLGGKRVVQRWDVEAALGAAAAAGGPARRTREEWAAVVQDFLDEPVQG